jgi:hypothetical protein
MRHFAWPSIIALICVAFCLAVALPLAAYAQAAVADTAKAEECSDEELQASVPALKNLHEVVYPLWHTAYPNKDYAMIKELLPEADALTAKVDEAKLPGILRDHQVAWDKGKEVLKTSLKDLRAAVEAGDEEAMLKQTEAFHAAYEKLVRIIRPVTPELDAFHQELYKLYHYYMPEYDLEKMKEAAAAMQAKVPPLKESKLPKRVADRQEKFLAAVAELETAVAEFAKTLQAGEKDAILKTAEAAHTAYQKTEGIFD